MDESTSIDHVYTALSGGHDETSPHVDIVDISPFSPNPTLEFADGSIRMYRPLFGPMRLITEEKIGAKHLSLVIWACNSRNNRDDLDLRLYASVFTIQMILSRFPYV